MEFSVRVSEPVEALSQASDFTATSSSDHQIMSGSSADIFRGSSGAGWVGLGYNWDRPFGGEEAPDGGIVDVP